jgi:hypothetical protein
MMMLNLTFEELKEKLQRVDEVTLLELLNIHSDDIIERFEDYIEDKQEQLMREIY